MPQDNSLKAEKNWSQPIVGFTNTRGFLPHIQQLGGYYWTRTTTYDRSILSESERDIVLSAIFYHDGGKYDLDAVVVMPDHIHLILHPLPNARGYYSLRQIFHSIKSYSAKEIIASRGIPVTERTDNAGAVHRSSGVRIWQDEYYDHLIRNDADYEEKLRYLIYNPVEAGLVERPEDYEWLWYRGMAKHRLQIK